MYYSKNMEQKTELMIEKVDEAIKCVCDKVIEKNISLGEYADTVKALASLVEARAKLY